MALISDLQRDIAVRILETIAGKALPVGAPLRESVFAREFSVSRTPVRAALDYLCQIHVAEYVPRKGYVLRKSAEDLPEIVHVPQQASVQKAYNLIIDAYFEGALHHWVSEAELARRCDVDRQALQDALAKLSAEGLMRQSPGYGWHIAPLVKSREADSEDLLRLRLLLEPAVFLEPGYAVDSEKIAALKEAQARILAKLDTDLDVAEVYEANDALHETLTAFAGNRFILSALDFNDPAARMNEYRHYRDVPRIRRACEEHLEILDAVAAHEFERASDLMRTHILNAQSSAQQARQAR